MTAASITAATTSPSPDSPATRIALLAAQAFALGLMTVWVVIPANAVFIDTYGASLLPVTYIGSALCGVGSSALLNRGLRRHPLSIVASAVFAGLAVTLLVAWMLLWQADAAWVSFGLLLLTPILIPIGFMFIVGQAGALLDVRVLKALYPRVIAGFAFGFAAGGLAGPLLLDLLGDTEHLLVAAAIMAIACTALIAVASHRYPHELAMPASEQPNAPSAPDSPAGRMSVRAVLSDRYVRLIVAFQVLSHIESQWLDYLVSDSAARRYDDSEQLARFISKFTAITYGTDILFLTLLAGVLLRRRGLRYGLTANPIGVLALVVAVIAATAATGSGTTVVFTLVVASRITDIVLSDGAARTSLSAAYQVVPTRVRLQAQATVEGLAVPLAIGFSGVVLLIVEPTLGVTGLALPIMTGVVVAAWAVVALALYRGYRSNLLASLRRRTLDTDGLILDDATTEAVIERLVDSIDPRDVRLGLDALTAADHPSLIEHVERFTRDPRPDVRVDALERLSRLDPRAAGEAAAIGVDDLDGVVRAASVHVLAASGRADAATLTRLADDESDDVRLAVAVAVAGIGDATSRARVAAEIERFGSSPLASQRIEAARMLGACDLGPAHDRSTLHVLLDDADPAVANAALAAVRWHVDAATIDLVVSLLYRRPTTRAAIDALAMGGDVALTAIDAELDAQRIGDRHHELLARVCRAIGGPAASDVVAHHLRHPDRELSLSMMTTLAVIGPAHSQPASPSIPDVDDELEHATRALAALLALDGAPSSEVLISALRHELEIVRRRVLAILALTYGADGLDRVTFQLAQSDPRARAMALEWLDVTLSSHDRAAVAVVEPGLPDRDRLRRLLKRGAAGSDDLDAMLRDLVEDAEQRWRRPWMTACALRASAARHPQGVPDESRQSGDVLVIAHRHADIVVETIAGLRAKQSPIPS